MAEFEYDGSLLVARAIEHHRDAGDEIDNLPDRDTDPEEHDKCVRAFHAHVKACDDYLESYRRSISDDNHDVDTGDPQDEKARRRLARQLREAAAL